MTYVIASLYGEASEVASKTIHAAQTSSLFWVALVVAIVCLTPNKVYAWLWTKGREIFVKHIVKPTPTPTPPIIPGVTPVITPEIKTAQDVSNLYHQFRAAKAARIAELEALLTKEKQELIDLDKMISQVSPPSTVVVTP